MMLGETKEGRRCGGATDVLVEKPTGKPTPAAQQYQGLVSPDASS